MSAFASRKRRPSIDRLPQLPRLAAVGGAFLWLCCSVVAHAAGAEACDSFDMDPLKVKVDGRRLTRQQA